MTVSITVSAKPATTLARTSSGKTISYGSAFIFTASLKSGGLPVEGQTVVLEQSANGKTFSATSLTARTVGNGTVSFSVKPTSKTWYRATFAATGSYLGSTSAAAVVSVRPYVSTPKAPKTMKRSKYYKVYGYLKPGHRAGSYPVRIYKYKKTSSGRWKKYGYIKAKAYNYKGYTKYSRKIKLTKTGKWRLRAYAPADSGHAAAWSSGYDYVKVK